MLKLSVCCGMEVMKGEIIALLGSWGCGKTSTLRMIAGCEEVSRGTIELLDRMKSVGFRASTESGLSFGVSDLKTAPNKEKVITAGAQQSAIDYNVFEGHKVKGLPRFTLTRGQVAIHDGEVRTQEGHGKFVSRPGNGTVNRALSTWKELTAPRPVERTGIPVTGV